MMMFEWLWIFFAVSAAVADDDDNADVANEDIGKHYTIELAYIFIKYCYS